MPIGQKRRNQPNNKTYCFHKPPQCYLKWVQVFHQAIWNLENSSQNTSLDKPSKSGNFRLWFTGLIQSLCFISKQTETKNHTSSRGWAISQFYFDSKFIFFSIITHLLSPRRFWVRHHRIHIIAVRSLKLNVMYGNSANPRTADVRVSMCQERTNSEPRTLG